METDLRTLRKALSDVSSDVKPHEVAIPFVSDGNVDEERIKQAECECCGLKEDCTETYITRISRCYSGKWVCGLCAEAVKERLRSASETAANVKEAVNSHRDFCQEFNSTTRANPKLSLTSAMRDIAKQCSQHRSSRKSLVDSTFARTTSCGPRINLNQ